VTEERGGCIIACDPFATDDECPGELSCDAAATLEPIDEYTEAGVFGGQCALPGPKAQGEPCEPGECGRHLTCGPILNDYGVSQLTCAPICSDSVACEEGACASFGLFGAADQASFGSCQVSCAIGGDSCGEGSWCAPSLATAGLGLCAEAGSRLLGESCAMSADCGEGLACDVMTGLCALICDRSAPACPSGYQCETTGDWVYGVCSES